MPIILSTTANYHINLILSDDWNRGSHRMKKNEFGIWSITVPAKDGQPAIPHKSKIKVHGFISASQTPHLLKSSNRYP